MTPVTLRFEGHYEVHETPFARSYEWHPAYVTLVCDCGQELALTGAGTVSTCRCGVDHGTIIRGIQEREGQPRHKDTHPWQYDTEEQAQQHLRNEAAYPEDSPWRYNDITSRSSEGGPPGAG